MTVTNLKLNTPMEILQASLQMEKDAYAFYDDLLKNTTVPFVAELLEDLRNSESQHVKKIQHKISTLLQQG